MLAAVGAFHVVSSANFGLLRRQDTVESEIQKNLEAQKDKEHAWYQRLTKEKEKQEWSELLNIEKPQAVDKI